MQRADTYTAQYTFEQLENSGQLRKIVVGCKKYGFDDEFMVSTIKKVYEDIKPKKTLSPEEIDIRIAQIDALYWNSSLRYDYVQTLTFEDQSENMPLRKALRLTQTGNQLALINVLSDELSDQMPQFVTYFFSKSKACEFQIGNYEDGQPGMGTVSDDELLLLITFLTDAGLTVRLETMNQSAPNSYDTYLVIDGSSKSEALKMLKDKYLVQFNRADNKNAV